MVVGIVRIEFYLHGNDSLKGKRRVASSLKQRLRNRFNVSVAEVEDHDSHTRLVIAATTAGNDASYVRGLLNKLIDAAESIADAEMTDTDVDLVHY